MRDAIILTHTFMSVCVCMCEVLSGRWADGWVDECVCSSELATSFRHVYSGEKEQL